VGGLARTAATGAVDATRDVENWLKCYYSRISR
jgi:hypothetical protein